MTTRRPSKDAAVPAARRDALGRRGFLAGSLLVCSAALARGLAAQPRTAEVPWLDEVQRRPPGLGEAQSLRVTGASGEPVTSLAQWQRERAGLRSWWLEFLGPLPAERGPAPALEVVEEDSREGVLRQLVRYEIEPGLASEAYLLRPAEVQPAKHPGVAVFHSTVNHSIRQPAGVEGKPEKAFGLKLAKRGYVAFCPRNFLWPDNHRIVAGEETQRFHQRQPQSKGMAKMLYDALVAVDVLAARPEVDAQRLGAVGHSLGAKEVLYLAAFDPRVKVTVSSEGGIGTTFSNWDAPWYLGETIKEPGFQHEHHELLALAAPRPFLLIGGDSADGDRSWPYVEAALEIYRLYGGRPRIGLFSHRQGHAVPPEAEQRIESWFDAYL